MLLDIQTRFAEAIRDPGANPPADVRATTGETPVRRFAVYRSNVMSGLSGALMSRFPVGVAIVGEEFFRQMARAYVSLFPPRSPVLLAYGDAFPDFVAGFEPARDVPYLADILRLEVARATAYHAADDRPLTAVEFAALDPATLPDLKLRLHPAAHLVRSEHPIVTIWSMNSGVLPLAPIEDWRGEDALVTRPALEVLVHRLPPGGFAFLAALRAGASLGEAVETAASEAADFDAGLALAGLVTSGAALSNS